MDNNRSSGFYNPSDMPQSAQRKHLFTNRQNFQDKNDDSDSYFNRDGMTNYLPERSSKLWNHITTRPYSSNNQSTSSYINTKPLEDHDTFESYKQYAPKMTKEDKPYDNYYEDKIEAVSDVFSETEDNTSMFNKLQTLSFRSPMTNIDAGNKLVTEHDPTDIHPSYPLESNYDIPEADEGGYPDHTFNTDKLYNDLSYEENKFLESNYNDPKLLDSTLPEDVKEDKQEYQLPPMFNAVKTPKQPDLNSVTTSDSVKNNASTTLFNIGGLNRVENADDLKIIHEKPTKVPISSGLTSTVSDNNPFEAHTAFPAHIPSTSEHFKERKPLVDSSFKLKEPVKEYTKEYKPYNRFTTDYSTELATYTNHVDYNPFNLFSLNNKGANNVITESEFKKLKSVLLSGGHSEDRLVKYFTEAIVITNNHTMKQIIEFLIGLIRDNHKVRQFVVRLLLCALSFHPEEFISAFRVEYLNVLFTPAIDDSIGVYFLKLLLSYKSTFNSSTEVNSGTPLSIDAKGYLVYANTEEELNTALQNGSCIDGKIETLYILKILVDRNKVGSVFDLPNSLLREQLCMIWYEMQKTMPKVNMVEILLHWINSKEDLDTKKYPYMLLERIRDTYPFPKGNVLLLSQFFLFTLKHKACVNDHLEYLITLVSTEPSDPESGNVSYRSGHGRENNRTPMRDPRDFRDFRDNNHFRVPRDPKYRPDTRRSTMKGTYRDNMGLGGLGGYSVVNGDSRFGGDLLALVLQRILSHFNEKDLIDLWCLMCVIPWKVTSPDSPFSNLFSTTLTTILKVTSVNYDNYNRENKIRVDLLENCLRICLVRCSCPINSLNALLQTTLLLNPANTTKMGSLDASSSRNGLNAPGFERPFEENLVVETLYRSGMILNSLCIFLWKCHFLWTRIKEGVNIEVVIVVTELYKILSHYTTAKPLDTSNLYTTPEMSDHIYKFFNNYTSTGLWTKITTFIPQIDLNQYFSNPQVDEPQDGYHQYDRRDGQGYNNEGYNYQRGDPNIDPFGDGQMDMGYNEQSEQDGYFDSNKTVGLKNLGNSCYLNSLLQGLYHTKFFVYNLLLFHEQNPDNEMVSALVNLFKKMNTTEKKYVTPKSLFKLVSSNLNKSQQDVTEAIRFISEAIDPDLELWKSVFAGLVVRRIKCLRCGSLSDNEETMYDFSLALNKAKTVQQMLDNFCNVEILHGENKYFCLKCNKDVKAHMWNIIASPPSHLIVILNRNYWDSNETQKVLKKVKIDSDLFITGFQYKLYGSIIHSGDSTESGHYYYIGCDSENFMDWHRIDDSTVKSSNEKEIDSISRDSTNTHVPYVLLYRCLQAPQTPKF